MYSLLILFIIIILPIPIMTKRMLAGQNAYRGVFQGTVTAVTGVTFILILSWVLTGISVFEAMNQVLNHISTDSMSLTKSYEMFGLNKLKPEELQNALEQMKEMMRLAIPGTMIVLISIVTYLNYSILSRIMRRFNERVSLLPPFRNFSFPRTIIFGSIIIYGLSYLTIKTGIIDKGLMMLTVQIVFTFLFSVQGLASFYYIGYIKNVPKIILVVIAVILIVTWFGQTFLFLLGLLDIVMNLRKRFSQTSLK